MTDYENNGMNAQPTEPSPTQPLYQQPEQPVYQQPEQPVYQQPVYQQQPQYGAPQQPVYQQPVQQQKVYYDVPPEGYPQKSRLAAALLALICGSLGIHNFYLGFKTRALIQLLVSLLTCGVGMAAMTIWAFVEGVLILSCSPSRNYDGNGVILRD